MTSWWKCLASRRSRSIRARTEQDNRLRLFLEPLENRTTPASILPYSTAGSIYTQNFDGMPNKLAVAPNIAFTTAGPFDLSEQINYTAAGLEGWQFGNAAGGTPGANASLRVNPGNSGTLGIFWNAGVTNSTTDPTGTTDRALVVRADNLGFGSPVYGVAIQNATGSTLGSFTLGFTAEIWKRAQNNTLADSVTFSYRTDSSPTANFLATTGYTNVTALGFTTPAGALTASNNAQLVGDAPANRSVIAPVTVSGVNWASGDFLILRWQDSQIPGNDDALGVDDFSFSAGDFGGGDPGPALPLANDDSSLIALANVPTNLDLLSNDTLNGATSFTLKGGSPFAGGVSTLVVGPSTITLNNNNTPTNLGDDTVTFQSVPGFSGPIAFDYTLASPAGSDTANVTVTVPQLGTSVAYTTPGSTYTQNFDGMPNKAAVAPNIVYTTAGPYSLAAQPNYTAAGVDGWEFGNAPGGTLGVNASLRVNPGNSGTLGVFWNAGVTDTTTVSTGTTDRALVVRADDLGFGKPVYGVAIRNETGSTLGSFTVGFAAEIWKRAQNNTLIDSVAFGYRTDLSPTAHFLDGTGFTDVAALGFSTPAGAVAASNNAQLVGDAPANRSVIAPYTVTGLNWANGDYLILRWQDAAIAGNDDALGVDDFSFSAGDSGDLALPSANADPALTAVTNVATNLDLLSNDILNGATTFTLNGGSAFVGGVSTLVVGASTVTLNNNNTPTVLSDDTVTFQSAPGISGSIHFAYTLASAAGSDEGDVTVNLTGPPSINPLNPLTLNEDASPQVVLLSGITAGSGQTVIVTATSSNPAIIPNPTITYTSPSSTGSLTFSPAANATTMAGGPVAISTPVTISITVNNGLGVNNTITRSFPVTISPINDLPTLDAPLSVTLNEDAATQTVPLTGISAGPADEIQPLVVTATSNNAALIPAPLVAYTSADPTGTLTFTPVPNASGSATITVTVNDGGPINNRREQSFVVHVDAVNDPPTLDPINPLLLNEDAAEQAVALTGISAGPANEAGQPLSMTAFSSDPSLVPNPIVTFASPGAAGMLRFTPVPDANGTATITVFVNDGQGANHTIGRSFTVSVAAVNDLPTVDAPLDMTINEDDPTQTVALTGISAGPASEVGQPLTVTVASNNTAVIPKPILGYGGSDTGSLTFTAVPDAFGSATITVTVNDGQGSNNRVSSTFVVTVSPKNDEPTLDALNARTINEDALAQTVALSGITFGPANEAPQPLSVAAFSSNPALIPNPTITHASGSSTATLTFQSAAEAFGTATITVIVNDGQGSNNTVARTFLVTVNSINDAPTLDQPPALFLPQDAGGQAVALTGISAGPANEAGQPLTVTAASSNAALIPSPAVSYAASGSTGTSTFTPAAGASGTATITVTVNDGQGSNNKLVRTFVVTVYPTAVDFAGRLVVNGTSNADTITVTESAGAFAVAFAGGGTLSFNKSQVTGRVIINGLGGDDLLTMQAAAGFADPLRGAILRGGDGDDTLVSGSGNDVLVGGLGRDNLQAGAGNDVVLGGDLPASVWTDNELDSLAGQWGSAQNTTREAALLASLADIEADTLTGGTGRDWFFVRGAAETTPLDFELAGPSSESPWDKQSGI